MKIKRHIIIIAFVISGILAPALSSQEMGIAITSGVDRDEITIGDLITYRVTIDHRKDYAILSPGLAANLGQFEIRDYEVAEAEERDDRIIARFDYQITTFDTGRYVIPPLTIGYLTPDSVSHALATEPIHIYVRSVLTGDAPELIDIKSPLEIKRDWGPYIFWGSIALLALTILFAAYYFYRRHKAGKSLLPIGEKKITPPHEAALEALNTLRDSPLLAEKRIKEFHVELSEIVRIYMEGRFHIVALEMTTTQLMDNLSKGEVDADIRTLINQFLDEADLVKFAKYIPEDDEIERTVQLAYDIVNRTMPAAVSEPEPEEEQPEMEAVATEPEQEPREP